MDLKFLIPSKVRRMVLEYFVTNPDEIVHVNELARRLKISPQQTYRELINMENWGFLFSSKLANQRMYRVNKKFILFDSLASIFEKFENEKNLEYSITKTYDLKKMIKENNKTKIPDEFIAGLKSPRKKPRAFDEEKLLNKK